METVSAESSEQPAYAKNDEQSAEPGDHFKTVVAILIALVALLGAVVAWRSALAADDAGGSDFAGLNATLNAENARTFNNTTLYEHYRTYTAYLYQNELGNLIAADLDNAPADAVSILTYQKNRAWETATASQSFFPNRYLTQDGGYDLQREWGEAWTEAGQQQDLRAEPHFAEADRLRAKSNWLMAILIILAISLIFYTLAEGLKPTLKLPRYSLALAGTAFMLLGLMATVAVELLM